MATIRAAPGTQQGLSSVSCVVSSWFRFNLRETLTSRCSDDDRERRRGVFGGRPDVHEGRPVLHQTFFERAAARAFVSGPAVMRSKSCRRGCEGIRSHVPGQVIAFVPKPEHLFQVVTVASVRRTLARRKVVAIGAESMAGPRDTYEWVPQRPDAPARAGACADVLRALRSVPGRGRSTSVQTPPAPLRPHLSISGTFVLARTPWTRW